LVQRWYQDPVNSVPLVQEPPIAEAPRRESSKAILSADAVVYRAQQSHHEHRSDFFRTWNP